MNKKELTLFSLILFLFLLPFTSPKNITFIFPDEVYLNEEFSIEIELIDYPEGVYDVKVDLFVEGERSGRILNKNQWKSTFYYINDIISEGEKKDFKIKSESYGEGSFEIKIKDTLDKTDSYSDFEILINEKDEGDDEYEPPTDPPKIDENTENDLADNEEDLDEEGSLKDVGKSNLIFPSNSSDKKILEPIKLSNSNPKSIKTPQESNLNKEVLSFLGLTGLLLFVSLLMLIKYKKYNQNEFG